MTHAGRQIAPIAQRPGPVPLPDDLHSQVPRNVQHPMSYVSTSVRVTPTRID
jgi:hypothetical protein